MSPFSSFHDPFFKDLFIRILGVECSQTFLIAMPRGVVVLRI